MHPLSAHVTYDIYRGEAVGTRLPIAAANGPNDWLYTGGYQYATITTANAFTCGVLTSGSIHCFGKYVMLSCCDALISTPTYSFIHHTMIKPLCLNDNDNNDTLS